MAYLHNAYYLLNELEQDKHSAVNWQCDQPINSVFKEGMGQH